jgi:hypothetical protein
MVIIHNIRKNRPRRCYWLGVQYWWACPPENVDGDRSRALVDLSIARWYHFVTRCVCRASLLGERDFNREVIAKIGHAQGLQS